MRGLALMGTLAALAASASVGFLTTRSTAAPEPTLARAAARTARSASQRFAIDVRITRSAKPLVLHVRGAAGPQAATVDLKLDDSRLPDGTVVPGVHGALLLDGPFLYERAPRSAAVGGKLRWIRLPVGDAHSAGGLRSLRDLLPAALLRVLGRAHANPRGGVYAGTLAYDDPLVRRGLSTLTGDVEFRRLRVTAWLGADGLVHRARISGNTADGSSTLRLDARLSAFGAPVQVTLPPQDALLDPVRERILD